MARVKHMTKPIVLVGMMGVGKSAVAQACARMAGVACFDADAEIEARAGKAIAEIFMQDGEPYFRALEERVIADLLARAPCFIATGGGAFMSAATRAAVQDRAVSIWLDVPVSVIYERIKGDTARPLLQTEDPLATLQDLLDARRDGYARADLHLKINKETLSEVAQRLLKELSNMS